MPAPLRIAQLTDIHLRHHLAGSSSVTTRRSRDMAEVFAQALRRCRELAVDLVAVTGDLVDVPELLTHDDGYYTYDRAAWAADAEADYRLMRRMLDESGLRYVVLPGNHDHEPLFWRVFDRAADVVDLPQGYRVARFADREQANHVPRRLDRERRRWERLLDEPGPPQIHLQHFLCTPRHDEGYPHTYLEGDQLTARTAASGRVVLSLSGHFHPGVAPTRIGGCWFATGRTLSEFPHSFPLYELAADGALTSRLVGERARPIGAGRPAVYLDRDGVINDLPSYTTGPQEMRLLPGAAAAIASLRAAGYAVVVVTNQSCIGLGYVTRATVLAVHDVMCRLLRDEVGPGAEPDAIEFSSGAGQRAAAPCFADDSDAKPSPALLLRGRAALDLAVDGSWMIGDRDGDLLAGERAGARSILVRTGAGRETERNLLARGERPIVVDDLATAARHILGQATASARSP